MTRQLHYNSLLPKTASSIIRNSDRNLAVFYTPWEIKCISYFSKSNLKPFTEFLKHMASKEKSKKKTDWTRLNHDWRIEKEWRHTCQDSSIGIKKQAVFILTVGPWQNLFSWPIPTSTSFSSGQPRQHSQPLKGKESQTSLNTYWLGLVSRRESGFYSALWWLGWKSKSMAKE